MEQTAQEPLGGSEVLGIWSETWWFPRVEKPCLVSHDFSAQLDSSRTLSEKDFPSYGATWRLPC